jgi:hypothetical protein
MAVPQLHAPTGRAAVTHPRTRRKAPGQKKTAPEDGPSGAV